MQVLETDIENYVVGWAENRGVLVTKLTTLGQRGWPDRVFWLAGGKPLLIEFKRGSKKPRKLQKYIHKLLKELGYDIQWFDNKEEAVNCLRARLASTRIPEKSNAIRVAANSKRSVPRSRTGKDQHNSRRGKGTKV